MLRATEKPAALSEKATYQYSYFLIPQIESNLTIGYKIRSVPLIMPSRGHFDIMICYNVIMILQSHVVSQPVTRSLKMSCSSGNKSLYSESFHAMEMPIPLNRTEFRLELTS